MPLGFQCNLGGRSLSMDGMRALSGQTHPCTWTPFSQLRGQNWGGQGTGPRSTCCRGHVVPQQPPHHFCLSGAVLGSPNPGRQEGSVLSSAGDKRPWSARAIYLALSLPGPTFPGTPGGQFPGHALLWLLRVEPRIMGHCPQHKQASGDRRPPSHLGTPALALDEP